MHILPIDSLQHKSSYYINITIRVGVSNAPSSPVYVDNDMPQFPHKVFSFRNVSTDKFILALAYAEPYLAQYLNLNEHSV